MANPLPLPNPSSQGQLSSCILVRQPDARVFAAAFWHLAAKWCIWLDTHAKIWQIGLTSQLTGGSTPDDIDIGIDIDVINENVC